MKRLVNGLFHAIFWIWNLAFLAWMYLLILPWIGRDLIVATWEGLIPSQFLFTLLALTAIPTVCTGVGLWKLRNKPLQLIRLFYGVEAPLFTLGCLRLFIFRELTPASTLMLGTGLICILGFAAELVWGYAQQNRAIARLQLLCHSLMGLVGLYVGTLLLFYAVPIAGWIISTVFTPEWWQFDWLKYWFYGSNIFLFLQSFLYLFIFGFSATLFLAMPSAMATFYAYSSYQIWQKFANQYGRKSALVGSGLILSAWIVVFISFQQQPQIQAFKLLENPATTDQARQELLAKSGIIRKGLLNAYLGSYRYLNNWKTNQIQNLYEDTLHLEKPAAQFVQARYNQLMSPFLYQGLWADQKKATKLYGEFFDTPIQKGEASAILHALRSTADQEQAKAGVLNINQERVWLAKQAVNIQENGDWAEIELYEVYQNQTNLEEEVFYSFSLPESAVITGLWLGNSANLDQRFSFQVSPRGAAQQVYTEQVQRFVDPALLEQVGPRHYRLRAFPVPRKVTSFNQDFEDRETELHLWLTYKVMRQEKGWPLPDLGEKRNVYWTQKTQRIENGKVVQRNKNEWLPAFATATNSSAPSLQALKLPGGYEVSAKPLATKDYSLPEGQRFAVVLDRSRSMGEHTKDLSATFKWLKENGFADNRFENNDADLYLTAAAGVAPTRIDDLSKFDVGKVTFYGTLQYQDLLQQFEQLRADTAYDAILLVTDEGSYELVDDTSDKTKEMPRLSAPLWMVHLGGLPRAYDDVTLKAIQESSGGVSTEIPEVLQRLATQAKLGDSVVSVVDGYAWFVKNSNQDAIASLPQALASDQSVSQNSFAALAARQLILNLSKALDTQELKSLDVIHAIAKRFEIVSPYSSMIVLVNDEQREALKAAEEKSDRFDREVETGEEELTQPQNTTVVDIPEPPVWITGVVAISLFLYSRRKRLRV